MPRKVAIITGASSGIGRAAARLFAAADIAVILGARRADALAAVASEIEATGGAASFVAGDVREPDFAHDLVNAAMRIHGRLDIAFNNAGVLPPAAPAHQTSLEDWNDSIAVNLTGAFLAARAQTPAMIATGGGSIIFTSTFVGHTVGFPGMAAYAASKAGLTGLTQVMAAELGPQKIRVNALLSGGVDTAMGRVTAPTDADMAGVAALHALKRVAEAEEIARAALFLAGDDASFVTGSAMLVDGGVSITKV